MEGYQIGYMSPVIFFAADVVPLSPKEIKTISARLRALRTAQLALVDDLSSADLLAGPGRPLQAFLSHQLVGGDDLYPASAFGKEDELQKTFRLTEKGVLDPRTGMRQSLSLALDRRESLDRRTVGGRRLPRPGCWTARKAVRFLLEWNWIQLNEIAARLGRPIVP